MDVLHYVDIPAQDEVLRRVRPALPDNGLFITRVGDAGAGLAFRLSNWVDRTVAFFRGNGLPPTHGRPLREWKQTLESLDFRRRVCRHERWPAVRQYPAGCPVRVVNPAQENTINQMDFFGRAEATWVGLSQCRHAQ